MSQHASEREQMAGLLRRTGNGDAGAFRALYALASRRLMPYAMRIVRRREFAEDVLQESFIAIWRDAARFDDARSAPMTWMATIVRNKGVDFVRANLLRERAMVQDDEGALGLAVCDPAGGPYESLALQQWRRQVNSGLTTLSLLHRHAIELAFFHDMSHREVALEMTLPIGTVKTWIRRGCRHLRQHVDLLV